MKQPNNEPGHEDAHLNLQFGDEEYRMTRYNTTLFTFFGRAAIHGAEMELDEFNHIFFQREETEDGAIGTYMFGHGEHFNELVNFIVENEFPAVINRTDVPECDLTAWERVQVMDLNDFVPEEWLGDGTDTTQ